MFLKRHRTTLGIDERTRYWHHPGRGWLTTKPHMFEPVKKGGKGWIKAKVLRRMGWELHGFFDGFGMSRQKWLVQEWMEVRGVCCVKHEMEYMISVEEGL